MTVATTVTQIENRAVLVTVAGTLVEVTGELGSAADAGVAYKWNEPDLMLDFATYDGTNYAAVYVRRLTSVA